MGNKSQKAEIKHEEEEGEEGDRQMWGSQLEFILTMVGFAVGLGNVWRFPYLCFENGGGAFLIPYLIFLILCGMPMFFFSICLGQFASRGPITVWVMNPMFKGIGFAMITLSSMTGLYYNVIVGYCLFYFFASMQSTLPWTNCDNWWNNQTNCLTTDQMSNKTYYNLYIEENNLTKSEVQTPSEQYFYQRVLDMSSGINDIGSLVPLLVAALSIAWIIVFLILIKGISSLGKAVYFASTFPYVMMTIMVIRGCLLPGATDGLIYYLKPNFTMLADTSVWADAANQVFFSSGVCSGGIIAMSSYNTFHNNALRDGIMIPIINFATSLYSGLAVFSVLGFLAQLKEVSVKDVATSGPGLIFVTYPEALAQMPVAPLWSILFFFMMVTLGLSSQFSMVESVFTGLIDQFPVLNSGKWTPTLLRASGCVFFYLISLPMVCQGGFYIFSIMNNYAGGLPPIIIGFFEIVAVIWIYGIGRYMDDIAMMLGSKPNWYYRACWFVLTPLVILLILIAYIIQTVTSPLTMGSYTYPEWSIGMGWMMVLASAIWIPIWFFVEPQYHGGCNIESIKKSCQPTKEWGPALQKNRTGRYAPLEREIKEKLPAQPTEKYSAISYIYDPPPVYDNNNLMNDSALRGEENSPYPVPTEDTYQEIDDKVNRL